ncbi:unnamed protein product [Symbiodinium necroappetens]|uniref:Na+/H+ antiporter NhaC-like C-terminal domain-containing protein n=1 Tax=Symbiodinium necroappetens TaxID=1628268 RepID=A0A812TZT4_9DINO|nr:unnamed protein product [Symbiodinium necroappetens]
MAWYPVLLLGCAVLSSAAPSFTVKGSRPTILEGVGFQLDLSLSYPSGDNLAAGSNIYVRVQKGAQSVSDVKTYPLYSGDELRTSLTLSDLVLNEVGTHELTVDVAYSADFLGASSGTYEAWVISGFVSLLPPLFVVLVAGLTQEVLWALWVGLFVAGAIVHQGNIFDAFLRTLDTYLVNSLADSGHAFVILFSWFLAGLVAVVQKSGGGHGIANIMLKRISTRRGVQLAVYLLGFVIFFDDYANTLILGNTMRGISDAFFVSREKLAFLVDATTAPIASLAPISSWIGFEVGLINDQLETLKGLGYTDALAEAGLTSGYGIFLSSLASRYYPIFMLVFQLSLIVFQRDAGPMLQAERRAFDNKLVISPTAKESEVTLDASMEPSESTPKLWWNSVVPILSTLIAVFAALLVTGYNTTVDGGQEMTAENLFGNGDSYSALLWGGFIGSVVTWVFIRLQYQYKGEIYNQWKHWVACDFRMQIDGDEAEAPRPILNFKESLDVWIEGVKGLTAPVLVLLMAWGIGAAVKDVSCDLFFASVFSSDSLDYRSLPTLTFLISSLMSFCTGTSWGTMSIMFPLVLPAAWISSNGDQEIFVLVVSAILAGSVFGDHATAISDTTILSSMATKCDLRHHVVTQLPYALFVAAVAIIIGYLPASFLFPAWLGLLLGIVVMFLVPLVFAEKVDHPQRRLDPTMRVVEWARVTLLKGKPTETAPIKSEKDLGDQAF